MATDPSKYKFEHTSIRIKDPERSVKFYEFLGMKQIDKLPYEKHTVYHMAYDGPKAVSHGRHWTDREGAIELVHFHGTEKDPNCKYANGNADPGKGFGHLCVSVDNIQAACQRLEDAGYTFQKRLTDGRMKSIAFVLDPDSYWVEIIAQNPVDKTETVKETDTNTYRMNHTMVRVKDMDKSLQFYQDNFGMKLKRVMENPDAQFNLYFLGYGEEKSGRGTDVNPQVDQEGLLELTWNYGTENDPNFKYHNGMTDPTGFAHIAITVDDLEAASERLKKNGVKFYKTLEEGDLRKDNVFVLDPDTYHIEVHQNETLKPVAAKA